LNRFRAREVFLEAVDPPRRNRLRHGASVAASGFFTLGVAFRRAATTISAEKTPVASNYAIANGAMPVAAWRASSKGDRL
jgi:hypothetical protein